MSPAIRSIRRRNALVPLPLLPPVPRNAIVTSVRIVHNHIDSSTDALTSDPTSPTKPNLFFNSASVPNPPSSPTQTSLCFPPLTGGGGPKRPRTGRRRSSCTPCSSPGSVPAPAPAPALPVSGGGDNSYDTSLLNPNRKPRSTIVVTVRLANETTPGQQPLYANPRTTPPPSSSSLSPAPRRTDKATSNNVANVTAAAAAMLARKQANKPRVSSPLAYQVVSASDPDGDEAGSTGSPNSSPGVSPLSSPTLPATRVRPYTRKTRLGGAAVKKVNTKSGGKAKAKGKGAGRVGMLRWAVLNQSGPEVGRRILSMGAHLAQEIWEAERIIEEADSVQVDENMEEDTDVSAEQQLLDHVPPQDVEASGETDVEREKLADACIRELEEMEVDSEDVEMEAPQVAAASVPAPATEASLPLSSTVESPESTTGAHPKEDNTNTMEAATENNNNNNNNMEVDVPAAPAAVVSTPPPAVRPLQVQVQLEFAVQVFSLAKKAQKELEKPRRWFERIAL